MPRSTVDPASGSPIAAFIGLGANLGHAVATLHAAFAQIGQMPLTDVMARSPMYRSAPVDAGGPDYVNAVIAVTTHLAPLELLSHLHAIERAHGRERPYRNAPRSLDLDLLLYADQAIDLPQLCVPHPRMHERAFVLKPLGDIAPNIVIPGRGLAALLLARVADQTLTRIDA